MIRYRTIQWPWAAFFVAFALLVQEMLLRGFGTQPPLAETAWRVGVATLGSAALTLLILPRRRLGYMLGALVCAGLVGYALYAQYVLGLDPCPLCILQRIAVIGCGVVFAIAAAQAPGRRGALAYALLTLVVAGLGALVSMRHLWLQSLPPSEVPACGPGLNYMLETLPFAEVFQKVFFGSGECATIDWRFLGLSMPAWTLVTLIVMIVAAFALVDRD